MTGDEAAIERAQRAALEAAARIVEACHGANCGAAQRIRAFMPAPQRVSSEAQCP